MEDNRYNRYVDIDSEILSKVLDIVNSSLEEHEKIDTDTTISFKFFRDCALKIEVFCIKPSKNTGE